MEIALYILFCIVCFAAYLYHDWTFGIDISLKFFVFYLTIAIIPLVNLLFLLTSIYLVITQQLLGGRFNMDIIVIEGKKNR